MTGAAWLQLARARRRASPSAPASSGRTSPACSATASGPAATGCSRGSSARSTACAASTPTASSAGPPTPTRCSPSARCRCSCSTSCSGSRASLPFNPTDVGAVPEALGVQHRGQLRHQHELAELRRREHDEPPHADGGAGGAELRVGRRRARRGRRPDPGPRAAPVGHHRQLLGRPRARAPCAILLPAGRRRRRRARQPGRHPEPPRPRGGHHRRGRHAGRSPAGPFASQEAIKELGTNGGGTLNANSAHPFENPNGFTNLLQIVR